MLELHDEARAAIGQLRELAHGIHPKILTDHGLAADGAAAIVAARALRPVVVLVDNRAARYRRAKRR